MSEGSGGEEKTSSDHFRDASDALISVFENSTSAVLALSKSIEIWAEENRKKWWLITLLVGALISQPFLRVVGWLNTFFFGGNVVASRDIEVFVHPLPLGTSLNLTYFLLFILAIITYRHIATLRRRVEELENKTGS